MPFLAHRSSVKLARTYNAVLVMDCTYKTNWFHMKLFDVVGITSFNTTFYVGFEFLQKETEVYYAWALENVKSLYSRISYSPVIAIDRDPALVNAVRHMFPTSPILLCTWHVNKNIAKNCKSVFETISLSNGSWYCMLELWRNLKKGGTHSKSVLAKLQTR